MAPNDALACHRPRVALRRSRAARVHLERPHRHPLHGLQNEVRQIVLRNLLPNIRRKQIRLRGATPDKLRHLNDLFDRTSQL